MSIRFDYGNARDVAKNNGIKHVLLEKLGTPKDIDYGKAFFKDNYNNGDINVISVYTQGNCNSLKESYLSAAKLAVSNGIKQIVFPLLRADDLSINVKEILGVAKASAMQFAETENECLIDIIIAIDGSSEKRLFKEAPCVFKHIVSTISPIQPDQDLDSNSKGDKIGFIVSSIDIDKIARASRDLTKENTDAVADAFAPYVKRSGMTISKLWTDILSCVMSKSSCYNILNKNRVGRVDKNNILAIAVALKLNLTETEKVLRAGGFVFTDSKDDFIFQKVIELGGDLYDVDAIRVKARLKPLCE